MMHTPMRTQYNPPLYLIPNGGYTAFNAPYANCTSIESGLMMIREHKWSVHGPLCGKTASVTLHYRTNIPQSMQSAGKQTCMMHTPM